jgi:ABC-type sugar transport system ATPase subunit
MSRISISTVHRVLAVNGANVVALQDMNLEIQDKELAVIVGPSGCARQRC